MTGSACPTITALHVLQYEGVDYLMSGAGCFLTVHEARNKCQRLHKQQVFSCQSVHGITSCSGPGAGTKSPTWIVVWGGRLIRMGQLALRPSIQSLRPDNVSIEFKDPIDVGDWILDVCVGATKSEILLLTAHNNLYRLSIGTTETGSSPDRECSMVCSGPQTLLYSGKVILARCNYWIIASGTVFGEIVVWTGLQQEDLSWKSRTRHTFLGHQGSVFGVSLSNSFNWQGTLRRLLASCSDDRTIRIWDVSDCEKDIDASDDTVSGLRDTGFGTQNNEMTHLAMAWGHLSRIWNIFFEFYPAINKSESLGLFSRGEDGICQLWRLHVNRLFTGDNTSTEILTKVSHDRHHAGKNVWSFVPAFLDDKCRVFSGGADGQIVARNFSLTTCSSENETSIPFKHLLKKLLDPSSSRVDSHAMPTSLKQYIILEKGDIIATTDTGNILSGSIHASHQWSIIHAGVHGKAITMSANRGGDYVFFSEIDASLLAYNVADQRMVRYADSLLAQLIWMEVVYTSKQSQGESGTFCLIGNMYKKPPQFLTIKHTEAGNQVKQCSLGVPQGFITTSSFYDSQRKLLVCGSRTGALAVFENISEESVEANNPHVFWHVHSSDTVTSIIELPESSGFEDKNILYLVSTGRDGSLSCHRVTIRAQSLVLHTVHRSSPPIGQYVEGVRCSPTSSGEYALVVHGFKSKEFVVWNESNQVWMMSVECGGAHRSWDYLPASRTNEEGDMFVWTKASTFNAYQKKSQDHCIVQQGSHGREIKALAISPVSMSSNTHPDSPSRLIATGAEDTDIRLLRHVARKRMPEHTTSFDKQYTNHNLSEVSVLRGHTTGIQHLMFSPCGRFLFSSGGSEEFYVWRLQEVPLLQVGVGLIAKLQKNTEDLDARIMSFDVMCAAEQNVSITELTILLVYSNGKQKLVKFFCPNVEDEADVPSANIDSNNLLAVTFEQSAGTICLTQAQLLLHDASRYSLTGATDGALRLFEYSDPSAKVISNQTHQSNIAAMTVHEIDSDTRLIVTGGDDNALGMTVLRLANGVEKPFMPTTLVPDAHAAALTAVATLKIYEDAHKHIALIVSAGNDQKVKLWRVNIARGAPSLSQLDREVDLKHSAGAPELELELEILSENWTDVADISNVEILEYGYEESTGPTGHSHYVLKTMVVGVGMQVLELRV